MRLQPQRAAGTRPHYHDCRLSNTPSRLHEGKHPSWSIPFYRLLCRATRPPRKERQRLGRNELRSLHCLLTLCEPSFLLDIHGQLQ